MVSVWLVSNIPLHEKAKEYTYWCVWFFLSSILFLMLVLKAVS